jgi:hypothetical protein
MTSTASPDPFDPAVVQQTRPADALEDWLTDLRVNLGDDPPDWLTPEDDIDPAPSLSTVPLPTGDHPVRDSGTTARSADPSGSRNSGPHRPAVGRHRAAE